MNTSPTRYPMLYTWLGYLVFILIIAGIVTTAVIPSPVTKLGVPLGLTLWVILAYLLRRIDQRRLDV